MVLIDLVTGDLFTTGKTGKYFKYYSEFNKLYKLTVNMGEKRNIIAGVAKYYTKEELIGKKTMFVKNLKEAEIRGVKSQGMLLVANKKKKFSILVLDRDVPNGTPIN